MDSSSRPPNIPRILAFNSFPPSSDFLQRRENLRIIPPFLHRLLLEPRHLPLLVDDDRRTAADVGFWQEQVVLLHHFSLHIREQVVRNLAGLAEGLVAPG